MPLLCRLCLVAYIDRQNVAYAKLQMVGDLGLSEAAYGLGSALFFLGYCIFEITSNLILERVGPRLWFARIIGAWVLVTLALGFGWTPTTFHNLRSLVRVNNVLGQGVSGCVVFGSCRNIYKKNLLKHRVKKN